VDEANGDIISRIASGNITNLEPELLQHSKLIQDTFKKNTTNTVNALFDAMEGGET